MRSGVAATIGSVLVAVLASACCWLPLALVVLGVSAAGLSGFIGQARPFLLGLAAVLLAIAFVVSYRTPRSDCAPDGTCAMPKNSRLRPLNRYGLWFSTLVLAASAGAPRLTDGLLATPTKSAPLGDTLLFTVSGMTCAGCESAVEAALARVPGVVAAHVDYNRGQAAVTVATGTRLSRLALATAAHTAGYELSDASENENGPRAAGQWTGVVHLGDGKTLNLVVDVGRLEKRWVGEFDVADFGIENYPVQVGFAGETVTLGFSAADADFEGTLSSDGRRLAGELRFAEEKIDVVFERTGEPQFSPSFLNLESAAEDPTRIEVLAAGAKALRQQFNADRNRVRLVILLSPT